VISPQLFRTELFVDGSTYHTSFASYPTLDLGTLAIGYQRLDVSDIERVDERNRVLGSFDNAESSLLVGYGRNVGPLVALGASLRVVKDLITPDRKMIVSGYDAFLGEVNVLVKFDKAWVECQVMYNQPVNCKQVGTIP
jgi:hypothetical protein